MKFAVALFFLLPLPAAEYATYIGDQNSRNRYGRCRQHLGGSCWPPAWPTSPICPAQLDRHLPDQARFEWCYPVHGHAGRKGFGSRLGDRARSRSQSVSCDYGIPNRFWMLVPPPAGYPYVEFLN